MPKLNMGEHIGKELPVPVFEFNINRYQRQNVWKIGKQILKNKNRNVYYDQNSGGVNISVFKAPVDN